LTFERRVETCEHRVERVGELTKLVVGPLEVDASREVGRLDLARHAGDAPDRPQDASGDDPARAERTDEQQAERGERVLAQLVERARVDLTFELLRGDELAAHHGPLAGDQELLLLRHRL
jgi:hypothetical protein